MKLHKFLEKNLIFVVIFSFFFISSTALFLSGNQLLSGLPLKIFAKKEFPPLPILDENVSNFPVLSAQSVLVVDIDSGITLYEKDPDKILLPASTTKIMTALVAMDYYKDGDILTIGGSSVEGQKMGLVKGEKITSRDLLYGLLIYSANDAAEALAQNYPGGRGAFIFAMNNKAKDLSLENTYFLNPSGLEDVGHQSTARDLVRLASYAMRNRRFSEIVATKDHIAESIDGRVHKLTNINELIGKVTGVIGVKTGWTENARENLVTYIVRGDKKVMISVLSSQDRFGETEELIEWIFENYNWGKIQFP